ncbi:hypothetical protein FBZ89_11192 [Nitrospirillum amazonense]|uniref:Uncharacterized protein n=1 Tax=Nitrospirillum amazonense TaxID=28077 RepID=A0A560F6J1_9PROT|nr:hypothetical protein FBZ89_11192 [Nitrospirillum amazonense]
MTGGLDGSGPETRRRFLRPTLTVTALAFAVDEPRELIGAMRERLPGDNAGRPYR